VKTQPSGKQLTTFNTLMGTFMMYQFGLPTEYRSSTTFNPSGD